MYPTFYPNWADQPDIAQARLVIALAYFFPIYTWERFYAILDVTAGFNYADRVDIWLGCRLLPNRSAAFQIKTGTLNLQSFYDVFFQLGPA